MIGREGGFLCFAVVVYITNFHLFGRDVWVVDVREEKWREFERCCIKV